VRQWVRITSHCARTRPTTNSALDRPLADIRAEHGGADAA
jgi:hypothetical protein